ncbi:hypothetical protein BJV77DRAFT_967310 [Russula vinacea]|nr:hypothetical protein BJV77DRAFT_967310 [Russula vinacea]
MSGPSDAIQPSGRERCPTEKVVRLAEARQEKENMRRKVTENSDEHKKKKAIVQRKAAQHEQGQSKNKECISHIIQCCYSGALSSESWIKTLLLDVILLTASNLSNFVFLQSLTL